MKTYKVSKSENIIHVNHSNAHVVRLCNGFIISTMKYISPRTNKNYDKYAILMNEENGILLTNFYLYNDSNEERFL